MPPFILAAFKVPVVISVALIDPVVIFPPSIVVVPVVNTSEALAAPKVVEVTASTPVTINLVAPMVLACRWFAVSEPSTITSPSIS